MLADARPPTSSVPGNPTPIGVGAPIGRVGAWRSTPPLRAATAPRVVAAAVAVLATVGVWLTWRVFVTTSTGQRLDDLAWAGATHGQNQLWRIAEPVLDIVSVAFVVLGVGAAMAMALMRRRWWLAVQVAVLVGGANVTTQLLKHVILERPDLDDVWTGRNTLPSGHTTVAASVSAALLLATPRRWRPLVAVAGAAYTGATGVSTLIGQWHRPSDVVAAVLVVVAWTAAVCALTPASSLDEPLDRDDTMATPGTYVLVGVVLLASAVALAVAGASLVGLADGSSSTRFGPDLTAYAGGVIGVLGTTAAAFAVLLLLRQLTARPRLGHG